MFIVEDKPNSIEAESYRTLRTNIQYSSIDKEIRSIVATSADPQDGKSTISGNLALSFAQNGKKVIIIDCDLRKPSMHKNFNLLVELKMQYEILIIDSPPLGAFSDGQILSTKVDGTILVVKAGESKRESVKEAKNLLNIVGANIIGVVVNKVSNGKKKNYYYYGTDEKNKITELEKNKIKDKVNIN